VPVLPIIALLILVYLLFRIPKKQNNNLHPVGHYALFSSVAVGLLLSVLASRSDIIHLMYLAPLWYLVLAWTLDHKGRGLLLNLQRLWFAYVVLAFFLMSFAVFLRVRGAANRIETRRGLITTSAPDTVIPYVQAHTSSDDGLLVYPYLPLYNYLTSTESPVSLDYFQPGMNTPEQAGEIISALQRSPDVLFEPEFSRKVATAWPGTPTDAVATDPVASYIRENYRVCALLQSAIGGRFEFRVRKQLNCR